MAISKPQNKKGQSMQKILGAGQVVAGAYTGNPYLIAGGVAGLSQNQGAQQIGNIANVGSQVKNISQDLQNPPAPQINESPISRKYYDMQKPQIKTDQEAAMALHQGEIALNQLRQTDPELANQIAPEFFNGILEVSKTYRSR